MENSSQEILTTIPDLNREILLELDDKTLNMMCITCKEAHDICKDDLFWRERIIRIFDMDLTKYKDDELSYRDMHTFMQKCKHLGNTQALIYLAIMDGQLPILKYIMKMLEKNNEIIYEKMDWIMKALQSDCLNIILFIIEKFGFDECEDLIALLCNIKVFKCLVEKGIIGSNNFAKFFHVGAQQGKLDIVTYIVEHWKPNSKQLNSAMKGAICSDRSSIITYLVKIDADLNRALEYASLVGNIKIVTYLIEAGADDLNSPLVISAHIRRLDIAHYLISKGANIHAYDDKALRNAEAAGNTDIIEYLRGLE